MSKIKPAMTKAHQDETSGMSGWGQWKRPALALHHLGTLERKALSRFGSSTFKPNLEAEMVVKWPQEFILKCMSELDPMAYQEKIKALTCFGEVAITFALSIVTTADWAYHFCHTGQHHLVADIPSFPLNEYYCTKQA